MSDSNNFDIFTNKINESEFLMENEMKKKILSRTYEKVNAANKKITNIVRELHRSLERLFSTE
jgi:uncharacterized protein YaaW (UPF0174 family)